MNSKYEFVYLCYYQMQKEKNHSQFQEFVLLESLESTLSIDCVKICPFQSQLWAFSFYQQMPHFRGGLQILRTDQLSKVSQNILEIGPIMHIQWLANEPAPQKEIEQLLIIAAHRQDKISICSYQTLQKTLQVKRSIVLGEGIFCLYCHWVISSSNETIITAVSTNQSKVFQFQLPYIINSSEDSIQIKEYNDHQYAVWACRLNSNGNFLVVGDEVNSLYLYNTLQKKLVSKNCKAHQQGICEIIFINGLKNDKKIEYILSGSFQGSIAKIKLDQFGVVLERYQIGGTIWRIIPFTIYQKHDTLLICNSSQHKFQIITKDSQQKNKHKILWDSSQQHTSLAYAADSNGRLLVTVSYYDKKMRIWSCDIKNK